MDEKNLNLMSTPARASHYFSDDVYHYQQLFDLSPNPILVCGGNGLLELNAATLNMFNVAS